MEWVDDAIVLGARHFGEGKLVAEVFARAHGRVGGVVHAGAQVAAEPHATRLSSEYAARLRQD